jgi:hypothetical protein
VTNDTKTAGKLSLREWDDGDHDNITLYCGDSVVAKWAEKEIGDQDVRLRYWIANEEESDAAIKQRAVEEIFGHVDVDGWTDEVFHVGSQDVMTGLSESVGKYLLLEVALGPAARPIGRIESATAICRHWLYRGDNGFVMASHGDGWRTHARC